MLGVGVLVAAPCAHGQTTYYKTWEGLYPASGSYDNAGCALCHSSTSGGGLNAYGSDITSEPGLLADRIKAVEGLNSDKDPGGASNLVEIQADAQPGWTGSAVAGVSGDLDPGVSPPDDDSPPQVADPDISVSTTVLVFGAVDVGTTKTMKVTISNLGGAELEVTGLDFTKASSGDFELSAAPTPPFTVGAADSAKVYVDYVPSGAGGDSAALEIESDSPGEELVTVSLSGTGVVPAADECAISVNPLELDFGSVEVAAAKTLSVEVTNAGDVGCEVGATVSSDAASSEDDAFVLVSQGSFTVDPGASVDVEVEYLPAYLGDDAGALDLISNDPDSPTIVVPLSGSGVDDAEEVGDALPNPELDLDIAKLAVRKRAWKRTGMPIAIRLMVQNGGAVEGDALATVVGIQNGIEVYKESRMVTDNAGQGKTAHKFPTYQPRRVGDIEWTATIEDGDPDDDVATTTTRVMNR
jgi:hypothetical protein